MSTDLLFEKNKHLGLITLARPQALNALNLPMVKALQQQLLQWQVDDEVHAVVIQAQPGKAFCAGGDVRWLYDTGLAHDPQQMQFFWHEYRLNHFISRFPKPYIALMDGITMGGGVGISLHGSHPVASERFIFAMPETGIGLFPDVGASYLLSRVPGQLGFFLALTGNRLNAEDACSAGLVARVISASQFPNLLARLQETDLSHNPYAQVSNCIQSFAEPEAQSTLNDELKKINHFFAQSSVTKIITALKESDCSWAPAVLKTVQEKSPLSLAITFAQLERAGQLTLDACLKMDYCLVSHFMRGTDFYEGVRALLIDKDKMPQWQACDNNADEVATYFEDCLPELSFLPFEPKSKEEVP